MDDTVPIPPESRLGEGPPGVVRSLSGRVLAILAWIARPLHISSRWASRFGFIVGFGMGLAMIQVDEYAMALVIWTMSAVVLVSKAIHWQGFKDHVILTRTGRMIYVFSALGFLVLSAIWTQTKRGDKPWTNLMHPDSSRVVSGQQAREPVAPASTPLDAPAFVRPEKPTVKFSPNKAASAVSSGTGNRGTATKPPEPEDTTPLPVQPLITEPLRLTPLDGDLIASDAQRRAAGIFGCLATRNPSDWKFCQDLYGSDVASIRDKLRNRGVQFAEPNSAVQKIETTPSPALLRYAARVLRGVADQTIAMSRPPVNPPEKVAQLQPKVQPRPDEEPIFVRHETGEVRVWVGQHGLIRGDSGVNITVRRSGVSEPGRSLASGERVEYEVVRSPSGVEAVNVKVVQARSAPEKDPLPTEISIRLPEKLKLSNYELASISRDAGRCATEIRVCLTDRKGDSGGAGICNSVYSTSVSGIRNDLRNLGITLEPLQDAVRRMERGATAEELQYVASVMDLLSQECAKRAR